MLSIRGLNFCYSHASSAALQNVSFDAVRGEVLGLLGPNGAGKTTLIAHLAGLLTIQSGGIQIDNKPLAAVRAEAPTRIAVAPQEYAFYPTLSVAENLDCFAGVGGLRGNEKQARIDECIAFAQLHNYRNIRAERLSGGLKRRLNLSIALLHRPELILFDEPTVGVDPQSRAFLLDAVKQLARQGSAVIYTSHYMEEVEAIADRIVILDQGRVLRQGTLNELLDGDARLHVAVEERAQTQLAALLATFGKVTEQDDGVLLVFAARPNPAAALAAVQSAGLTLRRARFGRADLEQLFMLLTHRSLRD
jgi:ABC-2 type transport system ATP-binding protein